MQRRRKQERRDSESGKRFMTTMLLKLPNYIEKYSSEERKYLTEFLDVLQEYLVDTKTTRDLFLIKSKNFTNKYHVSDDYFNLPFMWFAVEYLSNASRLLEIANFFGYQFYSYLVEHLRGSNNTKGAFKLICELTPLSDIAWEKLQYSSNRLRSPLNQNQLDILDLVISNLKSGKNHIYKKDLWKNIKKNKKIPFQNHSKLTRFFSFIDTKWGFLFNIHGFNLKRYLFHLNINNPYLLTDIIDFKNHDNSTLCMSAVYNVRDNNTVYKGRITIPENCFDLLQAHFQKRIQEKKLISYKLDPVLRTHHSTSFIHYQADKGWQPISQTNSNYLIQRLSTSKPRKRRKKPQGLYITPYRNTTWNICQEEDQLKIIKIFSQFFFGFTFESLPLNSKDITASIPISKKEEFLIKELINKNVISTSFSVERLRLDYSLDEYWIKAPLMSLEQLSYLLDWLPHSRIYFTEKNIILWAVLKPKIINTLLKLNWELSQVIQVHSPINPTASWFDKENCTFKPPQFL